MCEQVQVVCKLEHISHHLQDSVNWGFVTDLLYTNILVYGMLHFLSGGSI